MSCVFEASLTMRAVPDGALGAVAVAVAANSSSLLGLHREKRKAKYTAITTLSAARAAATSSGDVCKMSETATKLTAPPICHHAHQ